MKKEHKVIISTDDYQNYLDNEELIKQLKDQFKMVSEKSVIEKLLDVLEEAFGAKINKQTEERKVIIEINEQERTNNKFSKAIEKYSVNSLGGFNMLGNFNQDTYKDKEVFYNKIIVPGQFELQLIPKKL